MAGTPTPDNGALTVAHTVTSVGPYAFSNRRPTDHRAATAGGNTSPADTTVPTDPDGGNTANTPGDTVT